MAATPVNANEQLVRESAYHIWEQAGRPFGQADLHWQMAKELVDMAQPAAEAAPASKRRVKKKAIASEANPKPAKIGGSRKPASPKVVGDNPVYQ